MIKKWTLLLLFILLTQNFIFASDNYSKKINCSKMLKKGSHSKIIKYLGEKKYKNERDYIYLGSSYLAINEPYKAIYYYTISSGMKPSEDAYNGLAQAYFSLNLYDDVELYANKAIEVNPNSSLAYCLKGVVNSDISLIEKSLDLAPSPLAYAERARLNYNYDKVLSRALEDLEAAIDLDKRFSRAYYYRALIYAENQYPKLAIKDYSRLIKLNPDNYIFYFNRGMLRYELGIDYIFGAVKDFKRASRLNLDCKECRHNYVVAKKEKDAYLNAVILGAAQASFFAVQQTQTNMELSQINSQLNSINSSLNSINNTLLRMSY